MKLRHLLLLFISFFFVFPLYAEYFKHIGLSEGLTQPSVMAIYQDRLGRMWFGTKEGISQYDGNRVRIFKGWIKSVGEEPPVWLGNEVSFIVGDSLDNLYFLIDKNLIKYDIQTEKFSRLTNESIITALTSSEGQVWYMKHDSLFCLKADKEPTFVLKTNITSRICCLTMMDDQIGIGTYNGVYLIDRRTYQQKQLLEGVEIYRIFESSQKELWIGTRMHGLYRMNDKQQLSKVPYLPGTSEGISSEQIRDFVEDNEGNIWFGTFDGLHRYSIGNKQYSLIQIPQYVGGLNHPSIFAFSVSFTMASTALFFSSSDTPASSIIFCRASLFFERTCSRPSFTCATHSSLSVDALVSTVSPAFNISSVESVSSATSSDTCVSASPFTVSISVESTSFAFIKVSLLS